MDFSRGYGWKKPELRKQEDTKEQSYSKLMDALRVNHSVDRQAGIVIFITLQECAIPDDNARQHEAVISSMHTTD